MIIVLFNIVSRRDNCFLPLLVSEFTTRGRWGERQAKEGLGGPLEAG
jgi:hypothetical protein